MKTKCAWCQEEIKSTQNISTEEQFPISHGICKKCAAQLVNEIATPLRDFLDTFTAPVMLVDNSNSVFMLNKSAQTISNFNFSSTDCLKCGIVIGCPHSDKPEGCGSTIHCKSCVIRRSILHTDSTGEPCREIACEDKEFFLGERKANLIISTEKIGNRILLKIDPVFPKEAKE
ncbi:MAG: hypothetical protein Kow0029_11400 [Candidatus Rifleibacteriota bacterium]